MIILPQEVLDLIASGETITLLQLVRMDFDSGTLYANTSTWNVEWPLDSGNIYLGAAAVGTIDDINEEPGEIRGLSFTLNGVPPEQIALALLEDVQGRSVTVSTAICKSVPEGLQILHVEDDWLGTVDTMTLQESSDPENKTSSIYVTAENIGVDLLRPGTLKYTDADQQQLFPGDRGFEYAIDQADQEIIWPDASYGRQ